MHIIKLVNHMKLSHEILLNTFQGINLEIYYILLKVLKWKKTINVNMIK